MRALLRSRNVVLLAGAALLLAAIAWLRGGEYDEFYSVFLIAGDPRPVWPVAPFAVRSVAGFYHGHASFDGIALALRRGDVHPPLYFWALALWRDLVGTDLFRLRLLSVLFSLAGLALLLRIARRIGAPPLRAAGITLLFYGFAYTSIVARDFALTQLFALVGAALLIDSEERGQALPAILGGLALGAACFTNDLASFTVVALLAWLMVTAWRRPKLWLAAGISAALFLPAWLWFFIAQRGSRAGQFQPFHAGHAIARLAADQVGAILGALPLYASRPLAIVIGTGLVALILALGWVVLHDGLPSLASRYRGLVIAGAIAPPLGLLVLGAAFDNTPIEVRYVWLGLPYIGLALAAALRDRPWRLALLLAVEAASITGLALAPRTMQPAGRTERAASQAIGGKGLVIIPFGNDGVGIPGPFIAAGPPQMHVLVVRRATNSILGAAAKYRRVAIARIEADRTSKILVPGLDVLFAHAECWRQEAAPPEIDLFVRHCAVADR